jgi:hypothetical protein
MGATNHTTNYNLSQFVGTDKPAWLQDYNGDMLKIDTGINAAKVAADSAALDAGTAQGAADTANNAITNTITPAITALQTTVGNQGGSINTINSLIGNGTPTTTDQTIIGAINEIHAEIVNDFIYQGNEVFTHIADGVETYADVFNSLFASALSYLAGKSSDPSFYWKTGKLRVQNLKTCYDPDGEITNELNPTSLSFRNYDINTSNYNLGISQYKLASGTSTLIELTITSTPSVSSTDRTATVPPSGREFELVIENYRKLS